MEINVNKDGSFMSKEELFVRLRDTFGKVLIGGSYAANKAEKLIW